MSLFILSPLIYLLIGMFVARFPFNIKGKISAFLTKFVIPSVIVYNIATSKHDLLVIMLGMMTILFIMFFLSRVLGDNPVKRLCFFYLNIAWLGLPVGSAIWGSEAATILISVYIGSSLFCNSACVSLMSIDIAWLHRIRQIIKAPPVIALLIGIFTLPFGDWLEQHVYIVYECLKFTMTFLGMMLLGIWLATTKLKSADFKAAWLLFLFRMVSLTILITLFILVAEYYQIALVTQNKPVFYLLSFLPPAANLIILETYYLKTGQSASMIACGTMISLAAITVYVTGLLIWG
ncbi:hypothetical protein I926_00600 [Pasteurella multocida subsp. multocida OH4807]|nr:hypothetical protein I926_00600 [Pasteurella multocida subsp. multocida OH4807]